MVFQRLKPQLITTYYEFAFPHSLDLTPCLLIKVYKKPIS